jgi:hypothetical protein
MKTAKRRGARRSEVISGEKQAARYRSKKQAAMERVIAASSQLEPLLDEFEYSAITGESVATARLNRSLGKGCPFAKLGALVRYRPEDVRAYIAQNMRSTVSAPIAAATTAGPLHSDRGGVQIQGGA